MVDEKHTLAPACRRSRKDGVTYKKDSARKDEAGSGEGIGAALAGRILADTQGSRPNLPPIPGAPMITHLSDGL